MDKTKAKQMKSTVSEGCTYLKRVGPPLSQTVRLLIIHLIVAPEGEGRGGEGIRMKMVIIDHSCSLEFKASLAALHSTAEQT